MALFARADRLVTGLLRGLVGGLIVGAVLINFANVLGRYLFRSPFVWAEEIMQFMHIWAVMLGAAVLASEGRHLKMDAVYILASPRLRRILDVFTNLLGIAVSLYVIYYALTMIRMLAATGQRSVIARIPMKLTYVAIPLGFGCGVFLLAVWFYRLWLGEAREPVTRELAPPSEMAV